MSVPKEIEKYENGVAGLEVHHLEDGNTRFWISASIASISVDEEGLVSVAELLNAYLSENKAVVLKNRIKLLSAVVLIVVLLIVAAIVTGVIYNG